MKSGKSVKRACVLVGVLLSVAGLFVVFMAENTGAARIIIQDKNLPMNFDCLDNVTLRVSVNTSKDGYDEYNVTCPNGCEGNLGKYGADCVEPEYLITLWVIIGVVVIFFLIVFAVGRRR